MTQFTIGPRMTMELLHFHPEATAWQHEVPLLIIHGDADELVPYQDAADYCRRNPSVKLHIIPGVSHGFGAKLPEAFEATLTWFESA